MKICVVGWYLYEPFYLQLKKVHQNYPVMVVSHQKDKSYYGLPHVEIPNIGLEFGAYDYYLKNLWDDGSDEIGRASCRERV